MECVPSAVHWLSLAPFYVLCFIMQWEIAMPVGFPVCMRHNDVMLKIGG
jgi:hypothetical protein